MIEQLTQDTYKEELRKHRISVVKVNATWCGPCKFMRAAYERYAETYSDYNGLSIPFYKIDNDKNPEFIKRHKVKALPTFMFFVYGVHVFSIQGITRTKVFEGILDKALEIPVERK